MESLSFLELSTYAGLLATGLLTLNLLLGMMISTAYTKNYYWRRLPDRVKKLNILDIHNWTAYVALLLVLLHAILVTFDSSTRFSLIDIVLPVNAPHQKVFVALGTLSTYALIVVIITTQKVIKKKLGFRTWKNIHLISYGTALLFVVHGVVMDPRLKDGAVDYFDGEKLISEGCLLLLIAASVLRYRYFINKRKEKMTNTSNEGFLQTQPLKS